MKIKIDEKQNMLVVSVSGKLDVMSAPELEEALSKHIDEAKAKTIILNVSELDYVSSSGLRVVLLSAKRLKEIKCELVIAGLKDTVKDVFEISGFYSVFKIFETTEDALEQM